MLKSSILILTALTLVATSDVGAQTSPAAATLTDPQIAMIAVTADNVDIDAGKLAQEKGSSKEVKDFGATMVRDHTAVNAKATALAKKLNVTPEESTASKGLKADGDAMLAKLKGLSGAEFDKAYVDNEVAYHEKVIDTVTKTLIPNTKNGELKALLESAGPILTSHLEHAKHLQASLKK